MTVTVRTEPLEWYVDKIHRGEPFSSVLYGDGEWIVASRTRTGDRLAHGEVVTPRMEKEMGESLELDSPTFLRGTDLNLVEPWRYGGTDYLSVNEIGRRVKDVLSRWPDRDFEFLDGTVWDVASREGKLSPFLQEVKRHPVTLIGNQAFGNMAWLMPYDFIRIPESNAYSAINHVEHEIIHRNRGGVYLFCMGLGAIPVIKRLHDRLPEPTWLLDLGSVLDVFVGLGRERGWRRELYANKEEWQRVIDADLEGVT